MKSWTASAIIVMASSIVVMTSSTASTLIFARTISTTCYGGMSGWSLSEGELEPILDIEYRPLPDDITVVTTAAEVSFFCDMFFEPDGPCSMCMKMYMDIWWMDSTTSIPFATEGPEEVVVDCWDFVGEPTDVWKEAIGYVEICQGKAAEIQEKPRIVQIMVSAFPKGTEPCPDDPYGDSDMIYRNVGDDWKDIVFRDFSMDGFWDNW